MPTTTPTTTQAGRGQAAAGLYNLGQLLVSRSRTDERDPYYQSLTAAQLALLRAEHEAYLQRRRATAPVWFWSRVAARVLIVLLISVLLGLYVAKYHPQCAVDRRSCIVTTTLLLLMLALNKVMGNLLEWNQHASVLPVLLGAIILTIAHDQRFSLVVSGVLAGLVVLQLRADLGLLTVLLIGVSVCVFQLREIRTRTKLIEVSFFTTLVIAAAVLAKDVSADLPWRYALGDMLWACGAALLAGFLVQGGLPLIERLFRVVTSITLLEWCDASKPLLRRLAMEAPGTYNHSLQLGTMCESAAEAIGARGLLARVGAYYHDIGKINKPEYFVENEAGSASKHEKLSPAMSLLIIVGHVKDGIEMAHEYGLPPILHEFITSHHGTTLVQYFYHAAAEQRKGDTDRAPDEVEFRYPGPKPHMKEAAILMLADAAESSVRAMNQPTAGHIETQVHNMVTQRLNDGQLDECELTLKEVHQIEQSLIKSLCSIYHSRIAYPKPKEPKSESKPSEQRGSSQSPPAGEPDKAD